MKTLQALLMLFVFVSMQQIIFGQNTLTLNFQNMDPHLGQRFEVRVVDIDNDQEVARQVLPEISSPDFSIDLICMRDGRSYNIDFYADLNGNGVYDIPPTDHAWRETVMNVNADEVINFNHNTTFTDISYPPVPDFGYYEAVWGGKWFNITFGSTDSIRLDLKADCDSVHMTMTTSGIFGNPQEVTFEFSDTLPDNYDPETDTILLNINGPLVGTISFSNGIFSGDFLDPILMLGLQFTGNAGPDQSMALYTVFMGATPFAVGYFYVRELDVIEERAPLELILVGSDSASCFGAQDGIATVQAEGGTEPYQYEWSDGETGDTRTDLSAGIYTITATDINGCMDSLNLEIFEPDPFVLTLVSSDSVYCNGGMDGMAMVEANGGTAPYNFMWSDGGNGATRDDLAAGEYIVIGSDANGCMDTITVEIFEPLKINISLLKRDSVSCSGEMDGLLEVEGINGLAPYTYSWSTGGVGPILDSLSEGVYSVTVTDFKGCFSDSSFTINQPDSLTTITTSTNESFPFAGDGTASTLPSGGTPPYAYLWATGDTTSEITGLSSGNYPVTITDKNGCQLMDIAFVGTNMNPCSLSVEITGIDSICQGGSSRLTAEITPADTVFYSWNTGETTKSIDITEAGVYSVVITYGFPFCMDSDTIEVVEGDAIEINLSTMPETAPGAKNGRIESDVMGGFPPYTYEWSNGETGSIIQDLPPGKYFLTVTDQLGCSNIDSATVNSFICQLQIDTLIATNETNGGANGSIDATITGVVDPLNIFWRKDGDFYSNEEDIDGLSAGQYQLFLVDGINCRDTSEIITIENITSVNDVSRYFKIFPNPAHSFIRIEADFKWKITMRDMSGKEVIYYNGEYSESISLTDLHPGTYFMELSMGGQKWIKKLIVQ